MTHHILLASNSSTLRQSVYMELIKDGYQIFEAASGQETLAAMGNLDNLELLLIDVPLQDMDGIQLTRQIRDISIYRFLPIIMLVSKRSKILETEGLAAGITGWINQPATPDKLRTVITRLLG
jgi:two-component system, chemotaxis family, chemotaxis protein CheY